MEYVIPHAILDDAVTVSDRSDGSRTVSMSENHYRLLIELLYENSKFDEAAYLRANLDVAAAVKRGDIESGLSHFLSTGWKEGRSGVAPRVDEAWYLRKYPDVANAVRAGRVKSASSHFVDGGYREGRASNSRVDAFLTRWRNG